MWFKHREKMPYKEGFTQASLIALYIALIATLMGNGEKLFGKFDNEVIAATMMLSLLSVSVLICALLVLGKPYKLFIENKGTEALNLVVATTKWLLVFVLLVMGWVILK